MFIAFLAVGAMLLVAAGLAVTRAGHPRAVAPIVTGVAGILLIVAAVVIGEPSTPRPVAHRATPTPDFNAPQENPCLPITMPSGFIPVAQPGDTQHLPDEITGLPFAPGVARRSYHDMDMWRDGSLSWTIGSALADLDEGKYYSAALPGPYPVLDLQVGMLKAGGCTASQLVETILEGHLGIGENHEIVIIAPGPDLARVHAVLGCGAPVPGAENDTCAWATDGPGARLVGELEDGGSRTSPARAVATADLIFDQLTRGADPRR